MPTSKSKVRIIGWDLETSNLNANFGYVLCAGWKVVGEKKVNIIKISDFPLFKKDPTNDKEVVKEMARILTDEADGWLTWYGARFDVPYLNSRLIYHNLPILPPMAGAHVDGWRIARNHLKLNSNRLASVSSFFEVEEKTPLSGPIWIKAMAGHRPSLDYVAKHCYQDVIVLEQVYEKIKGLPGTHFNVSLVKSSLNGNECPRCGADTLQKRGFGYALTSRHRRFQCTSCRAWSRSSPIRISGVVAR